MHILRLTVQDYGLFRGRHIFDVSPLPGSNCPNRSLTIFSGHNGAGKSTLYNALMLGLYGPQAFGIRTSREAYSNQLQSRIHRQNGISASGGDSAGISVAFEFIRSGCPLHIQVDRYWRRSGASIVEAVAVSEDGGHPDIPSTDTQEWLDEVAPVSLMPLCFFDGEQLEALANPGSQSDTLRRIMNQLLGIDMIDRLRVDLDHYTKGQGGGRRALERLRAQTIEQQTSRELLDVQLVELESELDALRREIGEQEAGLATQERSLAAAGGGYAARRPVLQQRTEEIDREVGFAEHQLREWCGDLLPFLLAPALCEELSRQLTIEAEAKRRLIAASLWREKVTALCRAVEAPEFLGDLVPSPSLREALASRLTGLLESSALPDGTAPSAVRHDLADAERDQLQGWIRDVLTELPAQVEAVGGNLRTILAERQTVEGELQRAPDEISLAPMHTEITRLRAVLSDLRRKEAVLSSQSGAVRYQRDEQARLLQHTIRQLHDMQKAERQISRAEQSKLALEAFKDATTKQRLLMLEKELVQRFNGLCRKGLLLGSAEVHPDTYGIDLQDVHGARLDLRAFSAGERQLFALALLWALRRVSGRKLPLFVDTPLARLDELHRLRFMREFVPRVSDQVVLFMTDAEVDEVIRLEADGYLAHEYRLAYNSGRGETDVMNGLRLPACLGEADDPAELGAAECR